MSLFCAASAALTCASNAASSGGGGVGSAVVVGLRGLYCRASSSGVNRRTTEGGVGIVVDGVCVLVGRWGLNCRASSSAVNRRAVVRATRGAGDVAVVVGPLGARRLCIGDEVGDAVVVLVAVTGAAAAAGGAAAAVSEVRDEDDCAVSWAPPTDATGMANRFRQSLEKTASRAVPSSSSARKTVRRGAAPGGGGGGCLWM
mmetsp:Transcript_24069/g.74199  ORF Transcript_24069/g.74199 Transcript_24069/m.74199 type:complete len:201 (-) Transcript_24069:1009-1611(-)